MKKVILLIIIQCPYILVSQSLEWQTPHRIDWGQVNEGDQLSGQIKFKNNSKSAIQIVNVRTHCGCTVADIDKTEYGPGEKGEIAYTLRTRNYHGLVRKSISITWNDGSEHQERFVLEADIKREFDISPNYFSFYNTPWKPDTVITGVFVLTNHSSKPIQVNNIYSKNDIAHVQISQFKLEPNDSHAVEFSIKPNSPESKTDYIYIDTDFKKRTQTRIPVFLHFKQ